VTGWNGKVSSFNIGGFDRPEQRPEGLVFDLLTADTDDNLYMDANPCAIRLEPGLGLCN